MTTKRTKMTNLMDKLSTHYKNGEIVADDHIENRVKIYRKDPEFKRYGFTERGDYLVDLFENQNKKWKEYEIGGEVYKFPTLFLTHTAMITTDTYGRTYTLRMESTTGTSISLLMNLMGYSLQSAQ